MVVVLLLPYAEIGRNDHQEGASHYNCHAIRGDTRFCPTIGRKLTDKDSDEIFAGVCAEVFMSTRQNKCDGFISAMLVFFVDEVRFTRYNFFGTRVVIRI